MSEPTPLHKVVGLNGQPLREPVQEAPAKEALVGMFENLLAMAKSGKIQQFVGTGFSSDGMRLAAWGLDDPDVYKVRGAIAWLEDEYVARTTGRME